MGTITRHVQTATTNKLDSEQSKTSFKRIKHASSSGPVMHAAMYDFVEDLQKEFEDLEGKEKQKKRFPTSPHITLFIKEISVMALIDTGSQITCVFEIFFQEISRLEKYPTLPVSNFMVISAIGKKKSPVRHQTLLPLKIANMTIRSVFLIIPNLTSKMILGNDWLFDNRAVLDYDLCEMRIAGTKTSENYLHYGRRPQERIRSSVEQDVTYIQILQSDEPTRLKALVRVWRESEYSNSRDLVC